MIHQNELRIGNLVQINSEHQSYKCDGDIFTWSLTAFYSIEKGYDSLAWFDPIPLTEEWLERCGFVDVNNGYRATGSEVVYEKKDSEGLKVELWEGSNGWTIPYYPNVFTFVHQLQNLYFALTGDELNIEHTWIR